MSALSAVGTRAVKVRRSRIFVLAAFILSLESVFAALAGWLILDQYLSYAGLLGCTLIFAAVLMADVIPESWYKKRR